MRGWPQLTHSRSITLQILGTVAFIVGSIAFAERYEGCAESLTPAPAPMCPSAAEGPATTAELAAALLSDQHPLLRDDDGAAVLVDSTVVILLPASEQRPPAEAIAAALAPLPFEVRAGLGDRTALVVWLGRGHGRSADASGLPAWHPQLRLDLIHDQLTDERCLVRVAGVPDPEHRITKRKFNHIAEKAAAVEKLLVAALDQRGVQPLSSGPRAARLERDLQRMHSSGIWSLRQRTMPPSAAILMAILFIFFWRAAADGDATIAELDAPTLARDGALVVPATPGQSYRVLSYGLLHAGLQHLFNNLISLYIGCYLLEPALGTARTLLIFLVGVLGGGYARLARSRKGLLVGASGGAFAMNGATLALVLLPGPWVPLLDRSDVLVMMGIMLGAGLLLSFLPNISLVCHLGGALAGGLLVVSGLITLGRPTLDGGAESPVAAVIAWTLAGAGTAAWIAAGVWVRHLSRPK